MLEPTFVNRNLIRKMIQMSLLAKQKQKHRCREQIYGHQEGKESRRNWEIGIDIYIPLCRK